MQNKKKPKFKAKKGQVDYTSIRYAPVINCVIKFKDRILIVKRSSKLKLYPNIWNSVSGFLDDKKSIEEKVMIEMKEEIGMTKKNIVSIKRGPIFIKEEKKYGKTWLIIAVSVEVNTDKVTLDWEASEYKWIEPKELKNYKVLSGFEEVVASAS